MKLTLTFEGREATLTAKAENDEEKKMLGVIGAARLDLLESLERDGTLPQIGKAHR